MLKTNEKSKDLHANHGHVSPIEDDLDGSTSEGTDQLMADRRAREQRKHQGAHPEEGLLMHGLCHVESIQGGVEEDGHDEKSVACQLQMIG
jgi:hypothetical protein